MNIARKPQTQSAKTIYVYDEGIKIILEMAS
jgi:hypothetical protein